MRKFSRLTFSQILFLFYLKNIRTCGIVSATWSNKKRKPFAVFNSLSTIRKENRVWNRVFSKEGCSEKFHKSHRKTCAMEPLCIKVSDLQFSKNEKVGEKRSKNIKKGAETL